MKPVISLQGIGKVFTDGEETRALDQVSLDIHPGEFVAIMGASGSGKSTLMNIIGLLDAPTEGKYFLDGEEIGSHSDNHLAVLRRQKIGFVFQSFNLLGRLSAKQNVELPMIYARLSKKERSARSTELLAKVGLSERANYKPNQMSGGQTQRVAIARALANEPSLILADEPTGNLDSKSSAAIMELLQNLHKEGATIVMVTHNPELGELAQRIVTVKDGHILSDTKTKGAK